MTRELLAQGSTISVSKNHAWGEIYYTITNGKSTLLLSPSEWEVFKAVVRLADIEETEGDKLMIAETSRITYEEVDE